MRVRRGVGIVGALELPGTDFIPETQYLPYGYGNCNRGGTHPWPGRAGYSAQTATWFRSTYGRDADPRFLADLFWDCPGHPNYDDAGIGRALALIRAGGDPRVTNVRSAPGTTRPSDGPAYSFDPSSPAYTGVNTGTHTFNTPSGTVTVTNGVVTTAGSGAGGATSSSSTGSGAGVPNNNSPRSGDDGMGLYFGLAAAVLGVAFLFKKG